MRIFTLFYIAIGMLTVWDRLRKIFGGILYAFRCAVLRIVHLLTLGHSGLIKKILRPTASFLEKFFFKVIDPFLEAFFLMAYLHRIFSEEKLQQVWRAFVRARQQPMQQPATHGPAHEHVQMHEHVQTRRNAYARACKCGDGVRVWRRSDLGGQDAQVSRASPTQCRDWFKQQQDELSKCLDDLENAILSKLEDTAKEVLEQLYNTPLSADLKRTFVQRCLLKRKDSASAALLSTIRDVEALLNVIKTLGDVKQFVRDLLQEPVSQSVTKKMTEFLLKPAPSSEQPAADEAAKAARRILMKLFRHTLVEAVEAAVARLRLPLGRKTVNLRAVMEKLEMLRPEQLVQVRTSPLSLPHPDALVSNDQRNNFRFAHPRPATRCAPPAPRFALNSAAAPHRSCMGFGGCINRPTRLPRKGSSTSCSVRLKY